MNRIILLFAAFVLITPAHARSDLEDGFAGALRGCEEWILNPASWAQGLAPFVAAVGLGDKMGLVDRVDDVNLPPSDLRRGNHYWRINSTESAGYVLVVSDQLPMCHITGGGGADLQPAIEAVIASPDFTGHWEAEADLSKGDMASTRFRNREEPSLSIVISRAKAPEQRLDRVQLLATAIHKLDR
ncbi:MAG: hypothetical protein CVT74_12275 [Alphaproteobacteria bacterium HGW-Alphaproteobacteria-13]|jgi:hypothetical protein|nr:MAG: hypothetical protein CVT74_12275 [Alphaproteobacteria bacterium HGW-Alphaproteobacteria-13]